MVIWFPYLEVTACHRKEQGMTQNLSFFFPSPSEVTYFSDRTEEQKKGSDERAANFPRN